MIKKMILILILISICGGKYVTEVYDKKDDFNFDIVNFPYMCSNIPTYHSSSEFVVLTILVFHQYIKYLMRD